MYHNWDLDGSVRIGERECVFNLGRGASDMSQDSLTILGLTKPIQAHHWEASKWYLDGLKQHGFTIDACEDQTLIWTFRGVVAFGIYYLKKVTTLTRYGI